LTFRVEALRSSHSLDGFACGKAALDEWLKQYARNATSQGTRTYVLIDATADAIVGYFAIAPHLLERDSVPTQIGRGAPRQIPAILLAKLALDKGSQGKGLGRALLVRALEKIVDSARQAGGKLVVVDAIDDEAAQLYEHHDFVAVPGNAHRLVMKISTVARELGVRWP
jgi:GNAT superfamily N-acetyltransferase